MSEMTIWWILTGLAVVVELLTGTFYLLMVAIGLAAAALAAWFGASTPVQIVVAAVIGGGAVAVCHLIRKRRPGSLPSGANPDVNMDVGESVYVDSWNLDGTASVKYRGANWTVVTRPGNAPTTGQHRVAEVIGNRLVVDKI